MTDKLLKNLEKTIDEAIENAIDLENIDVDIYYIPEEKNFDTFIDGYIIPRNGVYISTIKSPEIDWENALDGNSYSDELQNILEEGASLADVNYSQELINEVKEIVKYSLIDVEDNKEARFVLKESGASKVLKESEIAYARECFEDARDEFISEAYNAFEEYEKECKVEKYMNMTKKEILCCVSKNGCELEYLPYELRDNKDIVLAAVQQNPKALQYASPLLQNDKNIVMAAIQQDGETLKYASNILEDDKDVVLAAIKQNPKAIRFASYDLRNDKNLLKNKEKDYDDDFER